MQEAVSNLTACGNAQQHIRMALAECACLLRLDFLRSARLLTVCGGLIENKQRHRQRRQQAMREPACMMRDATLIRPLCAAKCARFI